MNREIEFRGMTINSEWVYGFVRQNSNPRMKYQGWFIADSMHEPIAFEVIPATVGQYTGLKDKNGTKIFEGDVLKYVSSKCHYCNTEHTYPNHKPYIVKWNNDDCCFEAINDENYMLAVTWSEMEVVGNMHQNKELME